MQNNNHKSINIYVSIIWANIWWVDRLPLNLLLPLRTPMSVQQKIKEKCQLRLSSSDSATWEVWSSQLVIVSVSLCIAAWSWYTRRYAGHGQKMYENFSFNLSFIIKYIRSFYCNHEIGHHYQFNQCHLRFVTGWRLKRKRYCRMAR